jgi:hypothetical protein
MGMKLSLILRIEEKLRAFENRALRRIFGSKREKVTGSCRKLHDGIQILLRWSNIGK